MGKYKIIFDSTVYINKTVLKENNVSVASLNVIEGDNSYKELEVDVPFIFSEQDKGKSWTTSQPAPGEFLNLYEEAIKEGYERIFVLGLSSNISGTYQSANLAKNMLDNPHIIHLFDTQLCAYGTEMIGQELLRYVADGLQEEEIISRVEQLIKTSEQMFTVENLFALVKGGRLTMTKAAIGTVLRLKPVIRVIDGKLQQVHNERTYKKLFKYFITEMRATTKDYKKLYVYITSQNSKDSATLLKETILNEFPDAEITFTEYLGPVFSIHVGRKGFGLSWCHE
jgi:DegV family protein with EDD domain